MVKILKCYLIPKKSYGTLSKGAIFFGKPCACYLCYGTCHNAKIKLTVIPIAETGKKEMIKFVIPAVSFFFDAV